MKNISIKIALLLLCIAFTKGTNGQVLIGTDSIKFPSGLPLSIYGGYTRSASVYTSAEMNTLTNGGTITTLSWFVDSTNASVYNAPLFIYFKQVGIQTSASVIQNGTNYVTNFPSLVASATLVYSGTPQFKKGWNTIDITDFPISANQNLQIYVESNFNLGVSSSSVPYLPTFLNSHTSNNIYSSYTYLSPTVGLGGSPSQTMYYRPNIILGGLTPPTNGLNMTFISTAYSAITPVSTFNTGSTDTLIKIAVVTNGSGNPLAVTQFNFFTQANMVAGDVSSAKLYYTGKSSTFSNPILFGSIANPLGNYTITGNQMLSGRPSTNDTSYFWLTYDINCNAVSGHHVSAGYSGIILGGQSYTLSLGSNDHSIINSHSVYPEYYSSNTSTSVHPDQSNVYIGYVRFNGDPCVAANISEIKLNTGSMPSGTIQNVRCYFIKYTSSFADTATGTFFANAVANANGDLIFSGFQTLTANTTYFFKIVCDISCNAAINTSISLLPVTTILSGTTQNIVNNNYNTSKTVIPFSSNIQYTSTTTSIANKGGISAMGYVQVTGNDCSNNVTELAFNTASTITSNLSFAKCYYTSTPTFNNAIPFGAPITSPGDTMVFSDNKILAQGSNNYFWFVYELKCNASMGDTIMAKPISIRTNNNDSFYVLATPASNISKVIDSSYTTIANGDWSNPSIWSCGSLPPVGANVIINNTVTVNSSVNDVSNLTIAAQDTLIFNGGNLTMGQMDGDNKFFTDYGALIMNTGTFNINGQFAVKQGGRYIQTGGNINVDGNAAGGSGTSLNANLIDWNFESKACLSATGGTLTIIDPPSLFGNNALYYTSASNDSFIFNPNYTLRFGDGISIAPGHNNNGFAVTNSGSNSNFKFGKILVEGNASNADSRFLGLYSSLAANEIIVKTNGNLRNELYAYNVAVTLSGNLTLENGSSYSTPSLVFNGSGLQYITGSLPVLNSMTIQNSVGVKYNSPNANDSLKLLNLILYGKLDIESTRTLVIQYPIQGINGTTLRERNVNCKSILCSISSNYTPDMYFPLMYNNSYKNIALHLNSGNTAGQLLVYWNDSISGQAGVPLYDTNVYYTYTGLTYQSIQESGYWTIKALGGFSAVSYNVTVSCSGINIPENSFFTIAKRSSPSLPWSFIGSQLISAYSNDSIYQISRKNITNQFSDFAIALGTSQTILPLKISLLSFTGNSYGNVNKLYWKIIQDITIDHFVLQRSNDGKNFKTIANINTLETTNEMASYSFDDQLPFAGKNFYRLIILDKSGKQTLSDIVLLYMKDSDTFRIEASPNPVNGELSIKTVGDSDGQGKLEIYDMIGHLIKILNVNQAETILDMNKWENGMYLIRYHDNVHSYTIRISKI